MPSWRENSLRVPLASHPTQTRKIFLDLCQTRQPVLHNDQSQLIDTANRLAILGLEFTRKNKSLPSASLLPFQHLTYFDLKICACSGMMGESEEGFGWEER